MPAPIDHMRRCTAQRLHGQGPCQRPAAKHQSVCRLHGGASPQAVEAAEDREVRERMGKTIGRQLKLNPPKTSDTYETLRNELARSAETVDYLGSVIQQHDEPPAAWVALWGEERARLTKTAGVLLAYETKVTERNSRLDQADIDRLDEAMQAVVKDLGLDIEGDAVRQLVAFHVRRVIGRPAPLERPADTTAFDGPPPAPAEF